MTTPKGCSSGAGRSSASTPSATKRSGAARSSCTRRSRARASAASVLASARDGARRWASRWTRRRCPPNVLEGDPARPRQPRTIRPSRWRCSMPTRWSASPALRDADGRLASVGIQCAFCHSTVDNSVAPGIGRRLDGWPNRDLNVGAIIALAPDLSGVAELLQTDQATVRTVLNSWGPGKFDAQLFLDGKAFRPDGKTRGDAAAGGVRPRRRQPAHLDRLGRRVALERVRRQPRDARPGHVRRPAARRSGAVSRSPRAPDSATCATIPI